MIRSSVTYRRLWHFRRRNARPLHRYCLLIILSIFLAAAITYINSTLSPYAMQFTEAKTRTLVTESINSVINEEFGGKVKYTDLSIIKRDDKNRISSIEVNTVKLNEIAIKITSQLQDKLSLCRDEKVAVPIGALTGIPIFSAEGPDVYIKVLPIGKVDVEFVSEFSSVGSNQTRHRIYLDVKTRVSLTAPLIKKESNIISSIPVTETIILGNIPEPYINAWKSITN